MPTLNDLVKEKIENDNVKILSCEYSEGFVNLELNISGERFYIIFDLVRFYKSFDQETQEIVMYYS